MWLRLCWIDSILKGLELSIIYEGFSRLVLFLGPYRHKDDELLFPMAESVMDMYFVLREWS